MSSFSQYMNKVVNEEDGKDKTELQQLKDKVHSLLKLVRYHSTKDGIGPDATLKLREKLKEYSK